MSKGISAPSMVLIEFTEEETGISTISVLGNESVLNTTTMSSLSDADILMEDAI